MIIPLVEQYPDLILKLFNSILQNIWISKEWLISIIFPIYKKGAKDDPNNYRGIALMSCIGKLFLTIINNRLYKFTMEKNILSSSQLGFVKGNRTSDPHIILNNMVQKYCHKKKKKLYGCFVDFSKAFDSVPRDILLNKLKSCGINGKIYEIIKTLYCEDFACVKIGNNCSEPFKTNIGVRQGCVLSPLLFNIFLSDIQEKFDKCVDNVKLDTEEISCLIWADDILIISESKNGLQSKLNELQLYCKEKKLAVNIDKTKAMIFSKTGRSWKENFTYNNVIIENVKTYKYLGFVVSQSGGIKAGLDDLRIRGLKALIKIRRALGTLFHYNINNTIHIFNSMVKPILLYCSDFWGCLKPPKTTL